MSARDGKVALVTGGSGGIGKAILARLLNDGWHVALAASAMDRLEAARLTAPEHLQDRVTVHVVDVQDEASCHAAVAAVLDAHGRLDVLVNNAGIMIRHTAEATTIDEWQRVLDVNLTGAFRMAKASREELRASPHPSIVSISSTHATLAARGSVAYSVSKAGLSHLTRLLALEWAGDGIRVNAVAPTVVPSPMTADVLADPEYIARKFAAIPLGKPVEAEHVAAAVSYLISDDAASTTGQILILDGGESLP